MRKQFCLILMIISVGLTAQTTHGEAPEIPLGRLYTVETAVSVYGNGDGDRLWIEDLRRLETAWECVSPQKQAEFRDFLLPIYMRETMGIPLFEETAEDWTEKKKKILFDESF